MSRSARTGFSSLVALAMALSPALALADPLAITMVPHVPLGKKPTVTLKAFTRVVNVVLDLTRTEDDVKVTYKVASLGAGQSKTFTVGDGELGSYHWNGEL